MVGASICEAFGEYTHAKKQVVMKKYQLFNGNNIDKLRELEDNSVDAVVTDPPYGLSFMSKKWDYDVPSVELWKEVYRVLKPGGHVLSFGGTRTYHRMVVNMEDAGFEIRDQIQWLYGSGFPKSHNIGLNIDKKNGKIGNRAKAFIVAGQSGQKDKDTSGDLPNPNRTIQAYKSQNEWNGWGTALKPANEPICLARKPLVGTVAENVLQYGTGGLNIDGCRVGYINEADEKSSIPGSLNSNQKNSMFGIGEGHKHNNEGRWPANVIHDGSEEVVGLFPVTGGGTARQGHPGGSTFGGGAMGADVVGAWYGDSGSAARFFYCPKVSKSERNAGCDNKHPTVKPIDLMRY